ncbi:hypothetical protein CBS101457_005884 [Exobasidium rhododendri]|nr:hypothetical protein CBS101457_005884 [Exobasidium rhododendri]
MSNPFYPPKRMHTDTATRGNIGAERSQVMAFDPDRRGDILTRSQQPNERNQSQEQQQQQQQQQHPRQRTEGPGGASLFYAQDAPNGGDMSALAFGTGTDGFGGAMDEPDATASFHYAQDYRHEYGQMGALDGQAYGGQMMQSQNSRDQLYPQTVYRTPAYEQSPRAQNRLLEVEGENYSQQQLHHYPPPNRQYSPSPQRSFMGESIRPSTPGYYPDRAPKKEKLTESQKKIVDEFPSDLDEENGSLIKTAKAMVKDWRSWLRWKYTHYYIIFIVIILLVAFMTIYHTQIIKWLTPVSQKVRSVAWGFVIPVAILFVISFPPLFGHEIIGILLGVVYGLWIGFGVLSLGTLLGEWGNFYAFKHFLKKHAERYERKSLNYACMAYIVREGGFMVVLLARLSAIPGHFTTAVFATVGMGFFVFTLATLLSMPKQLLVVYLGVVIDQSGSGTESVRSKIVKYAVLVISGLITVGVAVFLYGKMQKARPIVQKQLQERRYTMLKEAGAAGLTSNSSEEGMLVGEGESGKLYWQGHADVYSMDDLESSQKQAKKGKGGASRWQKWRKTEKKNVGRSHGGQAVAESMESFEKGMDSTGKIVLDNGERVSFEADSLAHHSAGAADETLYGNNLKYVKSRPDQPFSLQEHQQNLQQQQQQQQQPYSYSQTAPFQDQRGAGSTLDHRQAGPPYTQQNRQYNNGQGYYS